MTQLLYIANPLQMTFTAHIQEVTAQDGFSEVILDRTCFYPTGGGQSHDRGMLAGLPVVDVRKENGVVVHRVQGEVAPGQEVEGAVDASYRLNNMHAHSGQHLLSATFLHLLDAATVAVKMNAEGISTVDVDRAELSADELRLVEDRANAIIREDRPIKSYYLAPDDPRLDELRRAVKFEKVTGDVRIVEIEDWDMSACAGTHVPSTGMLGLLKVLKAENYKGGSRVHFVAGTQALEVFQQEHAILAALSQQFSTTADDLLAAVNKLQAERQELARAAQTQREALLSLEKDALLADAPLHVSVRVVQASFAERSSEDLRLLANLLAGEPGVVALLVSSQGDDVALAIAAAEDTAIHAGNLLKAALEPFGGRGGGRDRFAQGLCKGCIDSAKLLETTLLALEAQLAGE